MGQWCYMCGRTRANEKFSGKGHHRHICKQCWPKRNSPEVIRAERLMLIHDRVFGQRNFTIKNGKELKALASLTEPENEDIARVADVVMRVCKIFPGRKNRWKKTWREHREWFDEFQALAIHFQWWLVRDDVEHCDQWIAYDEEDFDFSDPYELEEEDHDACAEDDLSLEETDLGDDIQGWLRRDDKPALHVLEPQPEPSETEPEQEDGDPF